MEGLGAGARLPPVQLRLVWRPDLESGNLIPVTNVCSAFHGAGRLPPPLPLPPLLRIVAFSPPGLTCDSASTSDRGQKVTDPGEKRRRR